MTSAPERPSFQLVRVFPGASIPPIDVPEIGSIMNSNYQKKGTKTATKKKEERNEAEDRG